MSMVRNGQGRISETCIQSPGATTKRKTNPTYQQSSCVWWWLSCCSRTQLNATAISAWPSGEPPPAAPDFTHLENFDIHLPLISFDRFVVGAGLRCDAANFGVVLWLVLGRRFGAVRRIFGHSGCCSKPTPIHAPSDDLPCPAAAPFRALLADR